MKNIFNFFNRKADYTAKKNDLANDAISFVVDEHKIYVKDQWFGGSGDGSGSGSGESTVIENPYDDTEVRGLISDVNSRLDNLVLLTQQDVQNTVTSMISDMRSFIDNFGWDAMFNDSGWDEEMKAYIQRVGFTDSENNQVSWSQFYQDFKTLQSVVSQINIGDTDEDINYETIQAMINSTIDGNTAINEIKSKWALAAENEKVLKWLASGFAAQANQGGSFAQVYAAGQNANTTAISALETRVDNVEDDVDSNTTAIASLSTRVDNAISGLVTQAALNNATSAIYSQLDGVTAAIATAVKKDANGNIESGVNISADQINLNGTTWADVINFEQLISNYWLPDVEHPTQGLTIDRNLISMYRTDGEETSIKTSTTIKPGYIHMSNMDSDEEFIFSTGGGSSSEARIYTYGDFNLWSPNVEISTPSAGKINLSTGTVDIDGNLQASNAEIDNLTTLNLWIPESGIINVLTPAGNGSYTPNEGHPGTIKNEGYTGTINGARFVKGICVGAA